MFHLLPENEKKSLKREYFLRLTVVALCFLTGGLIIGSVFLFPSYLISEKKFQEISFRNEELKSQIAAETDPNLSQFLASLKTNLSALQAAKSVDFPYLIKEITDQKTSGISLTQMFISKEDKLTIILKGIASNRDELSRFSQNLQKSNDFESVNLPVSGFAKEKDLDFSITIVVKKHG